MTTAEDLRVALHRAVGDPPPMSPGLQAALTGRHRPRRRRRGFIAGVALAGAAAAGLVAAWAQHTPDAERTGLERYEPAAIEAARQDSGGELPRSNLQVTVVMEVRYACQSIWAYLDGPSPDAAALLRRRLRSADRVGGESVRPFTDLVRDRLDASIESGSPQPLRNLANTDCPSQDRLRTPVRRGGP